MTHSVTLREEEWQEILQVLRNKQRDLNGNDPITQKWRDRYEFMIREIEEQTN